MLLPDWLGLDADFQPAMILTLATAAEKNLFKAGPKEEAAI
jgi:hypothetical protein